MDIQGKISAVFPQIQGTTEKGEYHIQPIQLDVEESFIRTDGSTAVVPHQILIDLTGDNAKNFNLPVGTTVKMNITFRVREYQGKKFQKISARYIYVV